MKTLPALVSLLALTNITFAAPPVSPRHGPRNGIELVRRWNQIAIDASGLDHKPVAIGENRVFGEQIGPCRSSRALAIVHIAMFDAVNGVVGEYESYTGVRAASGPMSIEAAIAEAAHDTLAVLFPSQKPAFDARLTEDLSAINSPKAKANGVDLGRRAAAAILVLKAEDGSQIPEPRVGLDYLTSDIAGHWRQDPISLIPPGIGRTLEPVQTFRSASSQSISSPSSARHGNGGLRSCFQ